MVAQEATDPIRKHSKYDTDDMACLGCGKRITPNMNAMEPYYCKKCVNGIGPNFRAIINIPQPKLAKGS